MDRAGKRGQNSPGRKSFLPLKLEVFLLVDYLYSDGCFMNRAVPMRLFQRVLNSQHDFLAPGHWGLNTPSPFSLPGVHSRVAPGTQGAPRPSLYVIGYEAKAVLWCGEQRPAVFMKLSLSD